MSCMNYEDLSNYIIAYCRDTGTGVLSHYANKYQSGRVGQLRLVLLFFAYPLPRCPLAVIPAVPANPFVAIPSFFPPLKINKTYLSNMNLWYNKNETGAVY